MAWKRIAIIPIIALSISACSSTKNAIKVENDVQAYEEKPISETKLTKEQLGEFEYTFIEALKQKQTGNADAAQQLFSRCLEIDPLSAASMYEMGKIHYLKKDLTSASLLLERAIDINPNNKWYKITLAQVYQHMKKYGEAAQLYSELYAQQKDKVQYLYTEAVLWGGAKNYDKAMATYDKFAEQTGKYEAVALAKQELYQQSGDTVGAIKEMEKLSKQYPQNTTYYGLLAELYHSSGNDEKALENYDKVFKIDPNNGFGFISLAGFYTQRGEREKGFDYLKKAFKSTQLDADTKIQYYLSEVANDKSGTTWTTEQVDELLNILHDMYPDDDRMYAVYADHFIRQGKNEEAREDIKKYLAKNPKTYEMWWQYLLLSNELNDWQRLLDDSNDALTHFPEQASIYIWKAVAELQLEKYDEAIVTAKKGLTYAGDNAFTKEQFQVFIADANYQLGNIDEAIDSYAKIIKNNPTNYGAMNNYAYYLSELNRDLDKAEACANKVIQANPTNGTYLDTYAWILFKQGDYELAKFYQETAIEHIDSDSGVFFEHYGDILYKLGETDKAVEQWEKAKESGDTNKVLDEKIRQRTYIEE